MKYINISAWYISLFKTAWILIAVFSILPNSSYADTNKEKTIDEIFIEATGNNKHEARVKASKEGMQRALYILADKFGVKPENLSAVNYESLKSVFTTKIINNELSTVDKYSATVSYGYTLGGLYSLLLNYGDETVGDKFNEYLIIPVFKQNTFYSLWSQDIKWLASWFNARSTLYSNKLYLPKATAYIKDKVNKDTIFNYKYDDFIEIFKGQYFKGVIIITAEFFTNRRTRGSYMEVKTHILENDNEAATISVNRLQLVEMSDIAENANIIIQQLIENYGKSRKIIDTELGKEEFLDIELESVQKPVIMNFDAYHPSDLKILEKKLQEVKEIDNFIITHDYLQRYKVQIYTSKEEDQLAEALYLNGLSFKIFDKTYHLIDIKSGI